MQASLIEKAMLTYDDMKNKGKGKPATEAEPDENTRLLGMQEEQSRERRYQKMWNDLSVFAKMGVKYEDWKANQEFERLKVEANNRDGSSNRNRNPNRRRRVVSWPAWYPG
jgi:hypothetical protein